MNQVQSYNVFKYKSGIVQLTITTRDKWVPYRRINGNTFAIEIYPEGDPSEEHLIVPELEDSPSVIITDTQEKDSIYFYFIPVALVSKIETFSGEKKV